MPIHNDDEDESPAGQSPSPSPTPSAGTPPLNPALPAGVTSSPPSPSTLLAASSRSPAPATPTPAPSQPQATAQRAMNATPSILSTLSLPGNAAPLSLTPAADAIKNFVETAQKIIGTPGEGYDVKLLVVGHNDTAITLFAASVVIVVQHKSQPNAALGYHTLIIGDTAGPINNEYIPIAGHGQVEVVRVIGESYNDEYRAAVASVLQKHFPQVDPKKMYDSEGQVVPVGYNGKDESLVRVTIASALVAAATLLNQNTPGFTDLSLIAGAEKIQTVAKLTFGNSQTPDSVGQPQRTDIKISFSELTGTPRQNNQGLQSLNSGQVLKPLLNLGGFTDLVWNPSSEVTAHNPYAAAYGTPAQHQSMPYLYQPRFVITMLEAPQLRTMPGELLGLVSALTMRDNNNWMASFHRPTGPEQDIHDIGAIGIEANIGRDPSGFGKPFDTRAANFNDQEQALMLRAYVRPHLAISLDVEECGPSTWLTSAFLAAAKNNQAAHDFIIESANLLTNGHFNQMWNPAWKVVINDESRVHLGHYTDGKGNVRDLRDIDHLCVLNVRGEQDPRIARDWSNTWAKIGYPIELRLRERLRIMQMISSSIQVTGYAQRITFTSNFLDTLERAIAATGLSIRAETPYQDLGDQGRASADWLNNAALSSGQSTFTRSYGGGQNQGGGSQTGGFGRWSR
jgi:hypothetical protein